MNFETIDALSYSILVAAVAGLARYRRLDRAYLLFVLLLWIGVTNEAISTIITRKGYSNALNTNIYYLLDALLLLVFFQKAGLFRRHPEWPLLLGLLFGSVWIAEIFLFRSIYDFSSYFVGIYAFVTVIMSIQLINSPGAFHDHGRTLLRRPLFLICMGLIFFYTYALLIEIFWVFGLTASKEFRLEVYRILAYINFFVNLVYTFALLWIPKKRESLLL